MNTVLTDVTDVVSNIVAWTKEGRIRPGNTMKAFSAIGKPLTVVNYLSMLARLFYTSVDVDKDFTLGAEKQDRTKAHNPDDVKEIIEDGMAGGDTMNQIILMLVLFMSILSGCASPNISPAEKIEAYLDKAVECYGQEDYIQAALELEKALKLSGKEYGEQSIETANVHLETALYSTSFDSAIEQIQLAEKIFEDHVDMGGLAKTHETYGQIYDRKYKLELAKSSYEEALRYCDMSEEDLSNTKFQIYLLLSALTDIPQEKAIEYCKEGEKLINRLPEEEKNESRIKIYSNMGTSYYNLAQDDMAIENYEKVIECWIQQGSKDLLSVAQSYDHCGYSYARTGDYDKGIEYINQSLKLLEEIESAELWDYAIAYRHLSSTYAVKEKQDYRKSLNYGIKSCQIYTEQHALTNQELKELKLLKEELKKLYEKSPMAAQKKFEPWYKENINK